MLAAVDRSATGHRRYTERDLRLDRADHPAPRDRHADPRRTPVRRPGPAGDGNEQERLDLLRAHRQQVLAQLAEVQDHLGAIDHKIGIYDDKLEHVALA